MEVVTTKRLGRRASADDAQKRMVERQVKTMERLLLGKLGDVGNEVRVLWVSAVSSRHFMRDLDGYVD